jgi:hypothetical protein
MIKKLRNQPYAPKSGSKLPNGSKEEEKISFHHSTVYILSYSWHHYINHKYKCATTYHKMEISVNMKMI